MTTTSTAPVNWDDVVNESASELHTIRCPLDHEWRHDKGKGWNLCAKCNHKYPAYELTITPPMTTGTTQTIAPSAPPSAVPPVVRSGPDEIRHAIATLVEPGAVFEIRCLNAKIGKQWKTGTVSGFFDNAAAAVAALQSVTATGIYITLNPVNANLLARRCNRLDYAATDELTKDSHITARRWMLVDVDPAREGGISGISATAHEKKHAETMAAAIREWLTGRGWTQPVVADSGNGWHLLYRIDQPAKDDGLVERCLKALAARFDNEHCTVDSTTFNPSRITKLYGTLVCKGDSTPTRPHRNSRIVSADGCAVVPTELLEALAGEAPAEPAKPSAKDAAKSRHQTTRKVGSGLDLSDFEFIGKFVAKHGIEVCSHTTKPDGCQMWKLASCPFDVDHGGHGEVALFQAADGVLGFKCHHNSCHGKGWKAFRQHYEPGCYDKTLVENSGDIRADIVAILTDRRRTQVERHEAVALAVVAELERRGKFYHHARRRDFSSAMWFDSASKRLLTVQSDAFLSGVAELTAVNRGNPVFGYIQAAVEDATLNKGVGIIPEIYWAARTGAIYMSNGDGRIAKVTAGKVDLVDNGTDGVLFPCGGTLAPWKLTEPQDPFTTCGLFRDANHADPHGKTILKLWMLSLPTNPTCKPPLVTTGEPGSGKTRTIRGIAELYGLPFASTTPKQNEKSQQDFWVSLDSGGIFTLDNCDAKIDWLADAVSTASTGAGDSRRKLYSDKTIEEFRPNAWLALTAANPTFATDGALADRLLVDRMYRRTGETDDAALSTDIAAHRDNGLSWVAHNLAAALADDAPVTRGLNKRHPDFAMFAVRLGRALGIEAESMAALAAAETDKSRFCLENDQVGRALMDMMADDVGCVGFHGTAAELMVHYDDMRIDGGLAKYDPDFSPTTKGNGGKPLWSAKRVGKRLAALWCHIEAMFDASKGSNRDHISTFSIRPRTATAGFAGFAARNSGNPHERNYTGTLPESLNETPQTPQTTTAQPPSSTDGLLFEEPDSVDAPPAPCGHCGRDDCDCWLGKPPA